MEHTSISRHSLTARSQLTATRQSSAPESINAIFTCKTGFCYFPAPDFRLWYYFPAPYLNRMISYQTCDQQNGGDHAGAPERKRDGMTLKRGATFRKSQNTSAPRTKFNGNLTKEQQRTLRMCVCELRAVSSASIMTKIRPAIASSRDRSQTCEYCLVLQTSISRSVLWPIPVSIQIAGL